MMIQELKDLLFYFALTFAIGWLIYALRNIRKMMGYVARFWILFSILFLICGISSFFLIKNKLKKTAEEMAIIGLYQTEDKKISANVLESTLFLMIGTDTMIIYDLKFHLKEIDDNNTYRLYHVLYCNSLNRNGYRTFDMPIQIKPDISNGGTLTALFRNNDSFVFGGYYFERPNIDNYQKIFDNWNNLYLGNTETKLRLNIQE